MSTVTDVDIRTAARNGGADNETSQNLVVEIVRENPSFDMHEVITEVAGAKGKSSKESIVKKLAKAEAKKEEEPPVQQSNAPQPGTTEYTHR